MDEREFWRKINEFMELAAKSIEEKLTEKLSENAISTRQRCKSSESLKN